MTPVAFLAVFCGVMAAIAIARAAAADDRDGTDVGIALVVVGLTVLSVLWVALEQDLLEFGTHFLLGTVGALAVCAGLAVLVRTPSAARTPQ